MKILFVVLSIIGLLALIMVVKNSQIPGGLGVSQGKLAPMPKSPNAVSSQSEDPAKRVDPIPFNGDLKESYSWIRKGLEEYGNMEILKEDEDYIHVVNTTEAMKYKDDLEFYFDREAALIHFRSASRIGYSDGGLNRKRYEKLLEILESIK